MVKNYFLRYPAIKNWLQFTPDILCLVNSYGRDELKMSKKSLKINSYVCLKTKIMVYQKTISVFFNLYQNLHLRFYMLKQKL